MGRAGAPVSQGERADIEKALRAGKSCNAVAKEFKRSASTVSKIARDAGIEFSNLAHSRLTRAREARKGYGAERRAALAERYFDLIERIAGRMEGPHITFKIGGKDNVYTEHELPEPDAGALNAYGQTIRHLNVSAMDIIKYDEAAAGGVDSDFDRWLEEMAGAAEAAAEPDDASKAS